MCLAENNERSTHLRRIDPIHRSTNAFCQREAGAVVVFPEGYRAQSLLDNGAVDTIPIAEELALRLIPRESTISGRPIQ